MGLRQVDTSWPLSHSVDTSLVGGTVRLTEVLENSMPTADISVLCLRSSGLSGVWDDPWHYQGNQKQSAHTKHDGSLSVRQVCHVLCPEGRWCVILREKLKQRLQE